MNKATAGMPQNTAKTDGQGGESSSAFSRLGRLSAKPADRVEVRTKPSAPQQGKPAPEKTAKPRAASESDIANGMLSLEREARKAESEAELGYLMVNGSRAALQYRQSMLLLRHGKKGHRVQAVSSLSAVDRSSTFIRWIESLAKNKLKGENSDKIVTFDVHREAEQGDIDAKSYPFGQMAMLPLMLRDGTIFAHLAFTRESEWDERSLVAAARLCETYSHAWEALSGPRKTKRRLRSRSLFMGLGAIAVLLAGFIPVPLTVLAPAEVTAADANIVAAPIDGVIETVKVDPNTMVEAGTALFSYSDTDLRNRVKLAGQAVSVAEARYAQALRTSFADPIAKRELSIAQSELTLKAGEYDYAKELLGKSVVKAAVGGLVIFADKDTWTGRPVSTGERIMRIADPTNVEISVNLPVADAIVLEKDAHVQLYLDSDPLQPIDGVLTSASFHAAPDGAGALSYRVKARFADDVAKPRIGLRGTAQVHGEKVKLAYFLFRKPLATIRQWTGW
ncbi:efflux RND transporter periplasmic adaptor subunit [Pseudahrensia aquimaris]|uniref:Efflux RND transporter periplasmic adaptor subunit n=1 Tax=Pseudahrensia aquimaris TaxID=744461 RepID=A0ABW3FD80_9HYPH